MKIRIIQYKWAGKKGFLKIKTHCNQCDLTTSILKDMMKNEFTSKPVTFTTKPWLDNIFFCLSHGAWHAPMVFVNGKKFWQHNKREPLVDRKRLAGYVLTLLKEQ